MDRNTNKERTGQGFPGYPHYPSEEDITNPGNGNRKINADVEELANSKRLSSQLNDENTRQNISERDADDDIRIVPGTEADVTEEDLVQY